MKNKYKPYSPKTPGSLFLLAYTLVFSLLFVVVLLFSRTETHIAINAFHRPFLDVLMKYWTYLGDGLFLFIVILLLLAFSFRLFFTGLTAYAFGGLASQLFKHLFFRHFPRPVKYFEIHHSEQHLYLIPGVDMHTWFSFPSGHTATAFALFFALALATKNRVLQLVLFLLAFGVACSRVYLSQHFLMDVVGGSFLGMIGGYMAWKWLRKYKAVWLDQSVAAVFRR